MGLLSYDAGPNYLLLRGPITDRGMTQLEGLSGLFALNLDAGELGITAAGSRPLRRFAKPRLARLRCDRRRHAIHRSHAPAPLPRLPGHRCG